MTSAPVSSAADDIDAAVSAGEEAGRTERVLGEAFATAEKGLTEAARIAERVIKEGVEVFRNQANTEPGAASETMDQARRYVVERIRERPVTAAFAGVGVGLLLGLLLSSRGK
jgi:ElaB/YqjD/DUF883 family membrane-anchored ribosome-binding protein